MSGNLVIQKAVPRSESVRAKLAELAWEDGVSAFIANQVPFSFSSGRTLATALTHIIRGLGQAASDVVVMELGAGVGYLSKHCLDVLADEDPEAYHTTSFVVTDAEDGIVRDALERGVLNDHADRARFHVASLHDVDSIVSERPRLLVMSYLVDAIPPAHIEQDEHGTREARIETSLAKDASVFDGGVWPPEKLGATDIAERLRSADLTTVLARRIVPKLAESWSWVPAKEAPCVNHTRFNSRTETIRLLCRLLDDLPDESGIVVVDFGYLNGEPAGRDDVMTEYGLCAFWAVAFAEIIEIAYAAGYEAMLSPGREGETHTLMIYKGRRVERMREAFAAGFAGMNTSPVTDVLDDLPDDATLDTVQAAVDSALEALPEIELTSYGNLSRLAHLLLSHGDLEGATPFAQQCVSMYPEVAAPEMAILGAVSAGQGEMEAARAFLERAIEIAPGFANAYFGLSELERALGDWEGYLGTMKALLAQTDCDVVDAMRRIASVLAETPMSETAAEAERWLAAHEA